MFAFFLSNANLAKSSRSCSIARHVKRLFRMALDSDSAVHILLVGPPASAKTMFLTSLMQLKNSYFSDGANSTKAGMISKRLTMPFGEDLILYLTTVVEADHSNIYDRIRRLEAGLKY
jgi:ATP-dependent protease Clp ATPase subunit